MDKNIKYTSKIKPEKILDKIKEELLAKGKTREEYVLITFQAIQKIVNWPHKNYGFICGIEYIEYLLNFFLGENFTYYFIYYNIEKEKYIKVYFLRWKEKIYYYSYQKIEKNYYELTDIRKEKVEEILREPEIKLSYNLKRFLVKN